MDHVAFICVAATCYAVALALELLHQFRRRPVHRLLAGVTATLGLLAQTIYLAAQRPPLASQFGLMLVLAWVFTVFYLSSSLHYNRQALGLFILPLVLLLVGLATAFGPPTGPDGVRRTGLFSEDQKVLGIIHAALLVLAAVGVCVAFLASLMYLVQAQRLKAKALPGQGLRLPSLERLEAMNRRALTLSFPLLTVGMVLGVWLMTRVSDQLSGWSDPRVLSTALLWVVFAILLYLRFGVHVRGRRVAFLTIAAFALLLVTLALPHMSWGMP
jgi:ABC-type uncharacterized transport system permease subunit